MSHARVVFDCNTLLQAIAFETGPAAKCLNFAFNGEFEFFISKTTLAELRRVLGYEGVLAISPNMTPQRIAAFLKRLAFRGTLMRRVRHVMDFARDPKDEPYIDLAVAAKADYLVTRDKDLLSLMTGHSAICKQFRQITLPLKVLDPVAFLDVVRRLQD
jgi:putative PIN family toxin of toxin-antitoxin system